MAEDKPQRAGTSRLIVFAIIFAGLLIGLGTFLGLMFGDRVDKIEVQLVSQNNESTDKDTTGEHTGDKSEPKYKSASGTYHYGAIATDAAACSEIGKDIMVRAGGNAIDAAVAGILCIGVISSHSSGIGGGSFWMIYDKSNRSFYSADSREEAPSASTQNMFAAEEDQSKSIQGGMASAVPGEVKGLWEVHQRFGRVPWKTLVKPTIRLCQNGVPFTKAVHKAAIARMVPLANKTGFEAYFDDDNMLKPAGSLLLLPKLAETYKTIADAPESFYEGSLAEDIVNDLKERGGIITLDDLKNYTVKWSTPSKFTLPGNLDVYSTPPPGSGHVLSYILNILSGYGFSPESIATDDAKILTYHRIIEAMKFAYAKRMELGDDNFVDRKELLDNMTSASFGEATRMRIADNVTHDTLYYKPDAFIKEDHGTSHLSVVDAQGNAVGVTSTINTYFGSKVKGSRTGIIFNNEMDDFSTPNTTNYYGLPASESNYIEPGKRPQSSMDPAIIWDDANKKVRLVVGAAGGSRITSATALNIMNVLWFKMSAPQSVDQIRLHHQLLPDTVFLYKDLPTPIRRGLEAMGHKFTMRKSFSVVQLVDALEDTLVAVSDYRKGGVPSGF